MKEKKLSLCVFVSSGLEPVTNKTQQSLNRLDETICVLFAKVVTSIIMFCGQLMSTKMQRYLYSCQTCRT